MQGGGGLLGLSITYYEVSIDSVVDRLKASLERLPDLVIAVLFGSVLRRRFVRDIDVVVYFRSEESLRDITHLTGMLEDELGLPVDVVPLRRTPPKLKLKALLDGVRLIVRDNKLYWMLVSQAFSETSDMELKLDEISRFLRRK
jgi:predicted nucleotidyltransferase